LSRRLNLEQDISQSQHGMLPRNIDLYDKNTGQFQWPVRWCGRALNATPAQKSTIKFADEHGRIRDFAP
jgi:hypothetical protein